MKIVARRSSGSLYAVGFGIALSFICRDARAQLGCDDTGSVPNEVLVKFRSADGAQKTAANALVGGQVVKEFSGDPNLFLVRVPEGSNLDAVLATYNGNKSVVEFAEKNRIYCPVDTYPNDPLLGYEWGLIGSAGIGAPRAWDYSVGSFGVSVADNDTGADLGHQDLVGNIGAAVSFIGGSAQDTVGHGTHTAGTIAASGNNGVGVSGVMWNANLLILKICNSQGCYLDAAVSAIDYGIQNGAWLSSNSWGGGGYSQALRDAIARADAAGLLPSALEDLGFNVLETRSVEFLCKCSYDRAVSIVTALGMEEVADMLEKDKVKRKLPEQLRQRLLLGQDMDASGS